MIIEPLVEVIICDKDVARIKTRVEAFDYYGGYAPAKQMIRLEIHPKQSIDRQAPVEPVGFLLDVEIVGRMMAMLPAMMREANMRQDKTGPAVWRPRPGSRWDKRAGESFPVRSFATR